jgi:predicted DNA-binding transcriptional regulator
VSKDQTLGAVILVLSLAGIVVYGALIWYFPTQVLEITAFLAVAGVLAILAWIGYTLATTPPPQPIEEIEKELQAEAKKAEGQAGTPEGTTPEKAATK